MADTHAALAHPDPGPPPTTVGEVLKEEWPKILISSLAVIVVFGGVSIESKLHPGSPWAAIIAGLPTGLISTLLIAPAVVPGFMTHYSKTTGILLITVLLFALMLRIDYIRKHPHWFVIAFILFWMGLNYLVNFVWWK